MFRMLTATCSAALLACAFATVSARAQAADDPAQGIVWDLSILFPDPTSWDRERAAIEASLPGLAKLKGSLGAGANALASGLDSISGIRQRIRRLHAYAQLKADEDATIGENQERFQIAESLQTKFDEATAFVRSEIVALDRDRVEQFEKTNPDLRRHHRALELILRQAEHTLGLEAESVFAATGGLRQQPALIHGLLAYADMPWPTIPIDGKPVRLDPETYYGVLFSPDRDVRRTAFEGVTATLAAYQRTLGAVLAAHLGGMAFEAKVRHYPSSLALALSEDNMPEAPFHTLLAENAKALPLLHRYLRLRKRMLGLDDLHRYDLEVPLASGSRRYRLDEAEDLTLKALAPLGDEYVKALDAGFHSHVMHASAHPGKRPGAYTNPESYGAPPFVLLTFSGDYDSVSSMAHEWGHAMHSRMAQEAQPFETSDYSVFVADTPSLTNEMLLADYRIAHASTHQEKILALSQAIDLLRSSYFGPSVFAEFELAAREASDRGEALTGQRFSEMYCVMLKRFYGAAEGVTRIDDAACAGAPNLGPLYLNFYIYKYLTATSAAGYFVEGLERGDDGLRQRYFDLLRAGGSDDPYKLLQRAGFDAALPSAYQPMVRRMDRLVAALESELARPPY